ncbi:uncharacterized protein [Argopecten irradians]|uniref:uncharacterized protein n=1 Tax=Argopecten irradians TaxID=31199 RepID=UPI00372283BC
MALNRDGTTSLTNPVQAFVMGGAIETFPPSVKPLQAKWAGHQNSQLDTLFADVLLLMDIREASNSQLNYWLARFVMEVRRKDGNYFLPNTLTNILSGLQRHLRESRPLERVNNTAQGLSYAVFFYNCKLFGFRGKDEHRNLVGEQFAISNDANINTTNRNISNHSGKVTCCTALYNAGLSDQAVMGRSGHRSNAVQVYQRESDDMIKTIINVLQPRSNNSVTKSEMKQENAVENR